MKSSPLGLFSGIALSAASMYLLDPTSGRRRRAQLRDWLRSSASKVKRGLEAAGRDLSNRAQGLAAKTRLAFADRPVTDAVLAERVRSTLGRLVSHPGAIETAVAQGCVAVTGVILAREYPALVRTLTRMRGVRQLDDRLEVHAHPGRISSLQGGRIREARFELLQDNWSPAIRLLTGTAGLGLMAVGLRSRHLGASLGSAMAGMALLLRSSTNRPISNLARVSAIEIHKKLRVNAPVEDVFETLARYENFPYFMRNVRSVSTHSDGRSRWCVTGPAGTIVEWDSRTTRFEPNRLIAWRTTPRASVKHSGHIQFRPENGGTCLEIHLRYRPPAGALGHGVALLFGVDPRTEMDEDLLRLKTFLETGKRAHDSAARMHGDRADARAPLRVPPQPIHAERALH